MGRGVAACALVCTVACGRIGFEPRTGSIDAATAPVAWVGVFVAQGNNTSIATDTFVAAARNAGDAIAIHLYCTSNTAASGVAISAPGWTFDMVGPMTGSVANTDWVASVGAIAPDTAMTTFTVAWAGTNHCQFMDELGDEFANVSGFGDHAETLGATGNCAATVTPSASTDTVWAACSGNLSAIEAGFTKGADDANNDWSEYRLTGAAAGSAEQVTFTSAGTSWVMTAMTIRAR
ncbi:MAG TPA: hypothetical protein VMJ10_01710 [Kofleriaceae bacterium]|nr:hypothetical protein [Kofleriaceae bacterium]